MNTVRLTTTGKLVICLLGSSFFVLIGWKCMFFVFTCALLYFFGTDVLEWFNSGTGDYGSDDRYESKHKKKIDNTIKQLDIYHKKLSAIPAVDLPMKAQYIQQIQYYKGILDNLNMYKTLDTMIRVIKRDDLGKIQVVQNIQTLTFYGIGDTIVHYSNEKAEIINIKEDGMKTKFLYNYLPMNEDLGELRENWTKHDAAFSNINGVMQCEQTVKASNEWWESENKRRDELPRYMVKIMYPKSIYKIGQIVECFDKNFQLNKETLAFCEEYPEIFEKVSSSLGDITKTFGILEFSEKVA